MQHRAVRHTPRTPVTPRNPKRHQPAGVWTTHIEGRYRPIGVERLVMYWSCYKAGHITYRQLRVLFAAEEMAERRRYTAKPERPGERPRKPLYTLDELKVLVGGRDSATADAALRGDLNRLAKVGLLGFTERELRFARSIDELEIGDTSFFQAIMGRLDHKRRPVPVPRRILRAIAGQFPAGVTAVVLATLIRGVFWHKRAPVQPRTLFDGPENSCGVEEGAFRIDHRTKREWIAEVFGISLRTVTASRQVLIDLGWIVPLDTPQWLLNRYGAHDRINPQWGGAGGTDQDRGGSASPGVDSAGETASPRHDQKTSSPRNLKTRRPAPMRAGPAGIFEDFSGRKGRAGRGVSQRSLPARPNIRDIHPRDLADTGRLLELHEQAVGLGLSDESEASRLEFVALAERARARGHRAGAMFYWLLREGKTTFITQHCEDQAQRRLRAHREGEHDRQGRGGQLPPPPQSWADYTDDERFMIACIRVAKAHRIKDPFVIAEKRGWTRMQWDKIASGPRLAQP